MSEGNPQPSRSARRILIILLGPLVVGGIVIAILYASPSQRRARAIVWVDNNGSFSDTGATISVDLRRVKDLSRLKHLQDLTSLDLTQSAVRDFEPLRQCSKLESFSISTHQEVPDLSPLAGLPKLSVFDVRLSKDGDVSFLNQFPNLMTVLIEGENIHDITPVSKLSNVRLLILSEVKASDLSALSGLNKLYELRLASMKLSDLSGLDGMKQLNSLSLKDTDLADTTFPLLPGLQHLTAYRTNLDNLALLDKAPKVAYVSLHQVKLASFELKRVHKQLERLTIEVSTLASLAGIDKMPNLTELNVRQCPLTDMAGIEKVSGLWRVDLSHTKISDLKPLSQLSKLQEVSLAATKINDDSLAALVGLKRLTTLNLSGTNITDEAGVHFGKLKSLRQLHLYQTKTTAKLLRRLRKELPKCMVYHDTDGM